MKSVTIVAQASRRQEMLLSLRHAGLLHIRHLTRTCPASEEIAERMHSLLGVMNAVVDEAGKSAKGIRQEKLDGDALDRVIEKHRPDIIVPEIEAIRTERLYHFEEKGIQVVPSARAVNYTMNRKAIRDLAAKELGLKTANYFYAKSFDELKEAAQKVGFPCVVKPLMSSSGKGQSVVKGEEDLEYAWSYACEGSRGDIKEIIVEEFIHFLPVLAYDGSHMKRIDAAGILDIAMSGTSATLLARRWESALLVNVDNDTLRRLMNNPDAMDALMKIEGFRNLNQDIETIINKSEAVKKVKKEANEKEISKTKKKELTEEEKEYKSLRKKIQEKLIKFATRIPVFMYLTDYRERSLKDVITQLEPGLFRKVTGLTLKDFELLVSLGVFNSALMNDAIYKFKRYEDASLEYVGINKHADEHVGLFDTVLSREDYERTFINE